MCKCNQYRERMNETETEREKPFLNCLHLVYSRSDSTYSETFLNRYNELSNLDTYPYIFLYINN